MHPLLTELKKYGQVKVNEDLSKHTTMKVGGRAGYFINVADVDKLVGLLDFLTGEGILYFVLGGGSNVVFADRGFDGVVIHIQADLIKVNGDKIICQAGFPLAKLVETAVKNRLSGLEWATGIPGTVGGAIRGNAGAMGYSMSMVLNSVTLWRDGEILTLNNDQCGFEYRGSIIKNKGGVILEAEFKLAIAEPAIIISKMQEYFLSRQTKYPHKPSAGSFFKNIPLAQWPGQINELPPMFIDRKMIPTGWLIEQLALKGQRIGDVALSEEHGNFIVNLGQAKQEDIIKLVDEITDKVYNKFGVNLEPEVELVL